MNREKALQLLDHYVKNPKMKLPCLASEAVMRSYAQRLGEDPDKWGLAGLLHDIDSEITQADPGSHALEAVKILNEYNVDPEIVEAIMLHNEDATNNKPRTTTFHHALAAGETITGLIFATAMVYPDKKISGVKPSSIKKRMKEKAFAASVKRENILECEKTGISLDDFIELSLMALRDFNLE